MRRLDFNKLAELRADPDKIRNICILAHVDHGKTTLADALIASNGVISERMIGKMRYMDNLPEEQHRGITMKSSSISLVHDCQSQYNLINLVDSPGHVDFCGEVSTATRVCDGALLVVDCVEGVCPQTRTLLRHAWAENLKPLLVLNKIDRLILELKLEPIEIYKHLRQILERLNAIAGEYFTYKMIEIGEKSMVPSTSKVPSDESEDYGTLMDNEERLYFDPCQGNVIFASAFDGWAFRVQDFAKIWARKANISETLLHRTLWGDFYLDEKTKRVKRGADGKGRKPLFVKMVLENLHPVYDNLVNNGDKAFAQKLAGVFKLNLSTKDLTHRDPRVLVRSLLQQWLPLSQSVLDAVCSELPPAGQLPDEKLRRLFSAESLVCTEWVEKFKTPNQGDSTVCLALVSKLFAVENNQLVSIDKLDRKNPQCLTVGYAGPVTLTDQEVEQRRQKVVDMKNVRFKDEVDTRVINGETHTENVDTCNRFTLLAFARIFSSVLVKGQKIYVTNQGCEHYSASPVESTVEHIYCMMGREFMEIQEARAGNVVALKGHHLTEVLSGRVATLSTDPQCPLKFAELAFYAEPILRVVVTPRNTASLSAASECLKLLSKVDPMVRTYVKPNGELVLACAGEVHLSRCMDDLTKRYSQLELDFSEPIVPFAETIVNASVSVDDGQQGGHKNTTGTKSVEVLTANKQVCVKIRAAALPPAVIDLLNQNEPLLDQIDDVQQNPHFLLTRSTDLLWFLSKFRQLYEQLSELFRKEGKHWTGVQNYLWSFGPKKARCNALFNKINDYQSRPNLWQCILNKLDDFSAKDCLPDYCSLANFVTVENRQPLKECDQSFINGFRAMCKAGPLCSEMVYGVAFFVEHWQNVNQSENNKNRLQANVDDCQSEVDENQLLPDKRICEVDENQSNAKIDDLSISGDQYGPISGQLLTTVKEGCSLSFQAQPQRLMAAMYACTIRCTTEVLGKVYAVLNKRNGKIIGEEMNEGTNLFEVAAVLPVVDSFGFADEMRKRTSAMASPQLVFSHWEIIDIDPFWVPTTQDELEHYGVKADSENRALKFVNMVRRRKGLHVEEQVVESGEKQRTLMKK